MYLEKKVNSDACRLLLGTCTRSWRVIAVVCTCLFALQTKTGSIFCYDCRMILVLDVVVWYVVLLYGIVCSQDTSVTKIKGQKKFEFHDNNQ